MPLLPSVSNWNSNSNLNYASRSAFTIFTFDAFHVEISPAAIPTAADDAMPVVASYSDGRKAIVTPSAPTAGPPQPSAANASIVPTIPPILQKGGWLLMTLAIYPRWGETVSRMPANPILRGFG